MDENGTIEGSLQILLGNGDGTFSDFSGIDCFCSSVAVGDFDGDGKADLVVEEEVQYQGSAAYLLLGAGDGTFTNGGSFADPNFVLGDFIVMAEPI